MSSFYEASIYYILTEISWKILNFIVKWAWGFNLFVFEKMPPIRKYQKGTDFNLSFLFFDFGNTYRGNCQTTGLNFMWIKARSHLFNMREIWICPFLRFSHLKWYYGVRLWYIALSPETFISVIPRHCKSLTSFSFAFKKPCPVAA